MGFVNLGINIMRFFNLGINKMGFVNLGINKMGFVNCRGAVKHRNLLFSNSDLGLKF